MTLAAVIVGGATLSALLIALLVALLVGGVVYMAGLHLFHLPQPWVGLAGFAVFVVVLLALL